MAIRGGEGNKIIEVRVDMSMTDTIAFSFPQYNINNITNKNGITNDQFKEIFGFYLGVSERESLSYDEIYDILSKITIKVICDKTTSAPYFMGNLNFNTLVSSIVGDETLYFDYITVDMQAVPIITFTTTDTLGFGIRVYI